MLNRCSRESPSAALACMHLLLAPRYGLLHHLTVLQPDVFAVR